MNWKKTGVIIGTVAGALSALAAYVAIGGPIPATEYDLQLAEDRTIQRVAQVEKFAEDTRELILLDKLFNVREQLDRAERALANDPDNEQLETRVFDLRRQLVLLERQLDSLGEANENQS